jgi:alkylmercury lyase
MTNVPDIDALAGILAAAMPRLDATEQQIALTLIGQLALGAPVSVSHLAGAAELSEVQITNTLDHLPGVFRDEEHRVVGFMGLTVVEMGHHRIYLDGRPLSAWCAWDTLFLPELLGETAYVTSRSPNSGAEISLTVTPTGPTDLAPADTVVSFLLPETEFDAGIIQRFCHFVHFFASPEDGARWTAEHPGTFLLTVEDAYRLGELTNRAAFGTALVPGGR